jgi:dextranase
LYIYQEIEMRMIFYSLLLFLLTTSCEKYKPVNDPVTYGASYIADFSTNKAMYDPGETVQFTYNGAIPEGAKVRYRKLDQTISENALTSKTWQWTAPANDFIGYMADIYTTENGQEKVMASIAIDVSSDYKRFPRNGFLSRYGQMTANEQKAIIGNLNRYHINVVQFQDWHFKHHLPLAGTPASPASVWKDIANRDSYLSTVKGYIDVAHSYGMKTLSYNLAYGVLSDAAADGVSSHWYIYKDANQSERDRHPLGAPFKSDIYLANPANTEWQQYIAAKNNQVYEVFPFDGWQIDQLGDRGNVYDASGNAVNFASTFQPFIQAMKTAAPNKSLVFNAVNQYGQQGIATSPVDFLYSEVWGPNEQFSDLATIIRNNDTYSNNTKKTVLAAYMNYDLANNAGFFNTPGVLLADAVIFAFGGSHLELGEHMLGKEYFPNNNLQIRPELKAALTNYYDFLVGYQNLLRDGGTFNSPVVSTTNNKMTLNTWPPQAGQVSVVGKEFVNRQVLHFINFANANSMEWRDKNGTQKAPNTITDAVINFTTSRNVRKLWMASPDIASGVSKPVIFTKSGNTVSFTLPSLQYWDMVVVEYE